MSHRQGTWPLRWYSLVYRVAYRLGLTVWDRAMPPPDLVDLVEGGDGGNVALRPGNALDLGCGTGTDSIYLARNGWRVTGVDMVPRALAAASRRAAAEGVSPRFVHGDVTRLHELAVPDGGYTLLLDFGCFHTLPVDRRAAYVSGVSRAAAPGATLLMYGFRRPPKVAPMNARITAEEIRERFSGDGWRLVHADPVPAAQLTATTRRANRRGGRFEVWRYQLRRNSGVDETAHG